MKQSPTTLRVLLKVGVAVLALLPLAIVFAQEAPTVTVECRDSALLVSESDDQRATVSCATFTPTATPTETATPTPSPTATETPVPTATPTSTPTSTPLPTETPTLTPTPAPTVAGTLGVAVDSMTTEGGFDWLGVEVRFHNDSNANASAALRFRKVGEDVWREALPLWRNDDGQIAAFNGAALELDAGYSYELEVTVADPDGGGTVLRASPTTRVDVPLSSVQLSPTRYVRANGNDAADGTTEATAWRTVRKAYTAAPAGAVVQVGPGFFTRPQGTRTLPLTLVAQYPAVDDTQQLQNAGQRSVLEAELVTMPGQGAWQAVDLVGPTTGLTRRLYKLANAPLTTTRTQAGYAATREEAPRRIQTWDMNTGATIDKSGRSWSMETPAGWADVLYDNGSYNYGLLAFKVTSTTSDVYLRLYGDVNPNTVYIDLANSPPGTGNKNMVLAAPDVRVSGFELRQQHIPLTAAAHRLVFDHNLVVSSELTPAGSPTSGYASDAMIEHNLFADTILIDDGTPESVPWKFIKQWTLLSDGTETRWWRTGQESETHAIAGDGGFARPTIRSNTFDGLFNGISGQNTPNARDAKHAYRVQGNLFRNIADDPLEPDTGAIGWMVSANRFERTSTVESIAPLNYGPLYFYDNTAVDFGPHLRADVSGDVGGGAYAFKYSGKSNPPARVYVLHNSFSTENTATNAGGVSGGLLAAGGGSSSPERFYLRDNIFRVTHYGFSVHAAGAAWDEDYNVWASPDGMKVGASVLSPNDYQGECNCGTHSLFIEPGGVGVSGCLPGMEGVPVPNLDALDQPAMVGTRQGCI